MVSIDKVSIKLIGAVITGHCMIGKMFERMSYLENDLGLVL